MEIADLIAPQQVIQRLRATDKRHALAELARRAAVSLDIDSQGVLDALLTREQLGTTGVGQGIAIPHARVATIKEMFCLFARLERPIDFAAIDNEPVDLVVLLLVPVDARREHLAALATVSRRLRDKDVARRLRQAKDAGELYDVLGTQ